LGWEAAEKGEMEVEDLGEVDEKRDFYWGARPERSGSRQRRSAIGKEIFADGEGAA